LNWLIKFRLVEKPPFANFPNHLLENAWVKSAFHYALSPHHRGAKWHAIGVIGGTTVKLPHCTSLMLAYLMENKMPLLHHVIE
jgi:hypothetical protein